MFRNRALWRTAGAMLFAIAMLAVFLLMILLPHAVFAQESHAQFWREESARQAALHPAHTTRAPARRISPRVRAGEPLRLASAAPLLAVASRYVGGRNPTGTRGPWCRDFVNHVVRKAGLPLADTSRKARDAVRLGRRVSQPRPGDLAVMRSHVTIVAGFEQGRVVGLGGNQCGGRVCVSRYAQSRVIAYVRIGA
jgi:uncharacterized protein (TIGR02594 family)